MKQPAIYFCDLSYVEGHTPLVRRPSDCPNASNHEPEPTGYVAWFDWAKLKAKTHTQTRCPGCNRWLIWKTKQAAKQAEGAS